MTDTKCIHVFSSNGAELDLVRSSQEVSGSLEAGTKGGDYTLTSAIEMLPTTLNWLSTTASDVKPSLFISLRASFKALSPLKESISLPSRSIEDAAGVTYLIEINCCDPIPSSLRLWE